MQPGMPFDAVRRAFKALALKHHPDKQRAPDQQGAAQAMMQRINAAFAHIR